MYKIKLTKGKTYLVTILSIGFIVVGIGCITWAMINIGAQPDYSVPYEYTTEVANIKSEPSPVPLAIDIDKNLYPVDPSAGDNIGSLTIPALNQELPIIQGTGTDELKEGVGHFIQSVLPGEEDNCVLSGHRDTVFAKLGKLKIGDQLIVETSAGIYTYEIDATRIVDKDDKTVIVPTDHAVLTLSTCYPFDFFGDAPDRYIITADLVTNK